MDGILKRFLLYKKTFRLHQKIQFYIWASISENSNSAPSPKIANPGLEQGLWRIEYLNTGREKQPEECQFATSGSTSGSSGSKLTLNDNKINNYK